MAAVFLAAAFFGEAFLAAAFFGEAFLGGTAASDMFCVLKFLSCTLSRIFTKHKDNTQERGQEEQ
ncbi:hypothetical protein GCM10010106_51210 [Thermopolyspora flexuosa]|nr:hypothetical protein GCM10010106_51210 [Thermopolyspora flexuosa]